MVLCAQFPSEKDIVWPFNPTPWVKSVSLGKYFLPCCCQLCQLLFDMQHDYFQKIYTLTFWPHPLGQGCVWGQIICYHVAASVVSFNLICNMTIFWKSLILASAPPPTSTQQTWTQAFKLKSRLICFISIAALPAWKISAKNINNCLSYCEIKIFDLWPLRWGQRRVGYNFDTTMLIYRHLAIMVYSASC